MLVSTTWPLAARDDIAIWTGRVPPKANPAGVPSSSKEIAFETRTARSVYGAPAHGLTKAFYKTNKARIPQQAEMAYRHLRRVVMRASVHQAIVDDEELQVWARSNDSDANQRPLAVLRDIPQSTGDPIVDLRENRDHGRARYWS